MNIYIELDSQLQAASDDCDDDDKSDAYWFTMLTDIAYDYFINHNLTDDEYDYVHAWLKRRNKDGL